MDLQQALTRMYATGVVLSANGDRLRVESPAPLTEKQRAFIRDHKAGILRLVSSSPPALTALSDEDRLAIHEATEERAAILEYEGGADRESAERGARSVMRVYRYRLSDAPGKWITLLCPGSDLAAARHVLRRSFGKRLLEVLEHDPKPESGA